MNISLLASIRSGLRSADPLPVLAIGYLLGVLTAACASTLPLAASYAAPPSLLTATREAAVCELPIFLMTVLAGLTRFSYLPRIPVFLRSLLWGYGGLRIFLTCGQSLSYFRYVLASGMTLLSLCCAARLASELAGKRSPPTGAHFSTYFGRCLFYWGIILLSIPLRF
ncbi:MAG: hypothetical protein IJW62_04025 [Clostridia bacterium]|nr:hypothetical protein [Clostridia bacterium]